MFIGISDSANVVLRRPKDPAELIEGAQVTLQCEIDGSNTPTVNWYRNKIR